MRFWRELAAAFALLTRLPVGHLVSPETNFGRAVWAYPVAGACVGLLGGTVTEVCLRAGFSPSLSAVWAVAAMAAATGGLHEDGLADTADGLLGGRTRERRLEIMRDSRIGAFGALALSLSVAVRIAAVAALAPGGRAVSALVVSGALGRAAIALVVAVSAPARADGLGATLAGVPAWAVRLAWALAAALAFALLPMRAALVVLVLAALTGWAAAWISARALGGYTGDILGAASVATECAVLSFLSAPP